MNVAENGAALADHDVVAQFRVPVATFLAGCAKRDVVQESTAIANARSRADDDTGRVVDHEATTQPCCRVDVEPPTLGDTLLDHESHMRLAVTPKDMRESMCLDRLETFEMQKWRQVVVRGTVAFRDGPYVATCEPFDGAHLIIVRTQLTVIYLHEGFLPLLGWNGAIKRVCNHIRQCMAEISAG